MKQAIESLEGFFNPVNKELVEDFFRSNIDESKFLLLSKGDKVKYEGPRQIRYMDVITIRMIADKIELQSEYSDLDSIIKNVPLGGSVLEYAECVLDLTGKVLNLLSSNFDIGVSTTASWVKQVISTMLFRLNNEYYQIHNCYVYTKMNSLFFPDYNFNIRFSFKGAKEFTLSYSDDKKTLFIEAPSSNFISRERIIEDIDRLFEDLKINTQLENILNSHRLSSIYNMSHSLNMSKVNYFYNFLSQSMNATESNIFIQNELEKLLTKDELNSLICTSAKKYFYAKDEKGELIVSDEDDGHYIDNEFDDKKVTCYLGLKTPEFIVYFKSLDELDIIRNEASYTTTID